MSYWVIVVEGEGPHHNDQQGDAEALGRAFVRTLSVVGQRVTLSMFASLPPVGRAKIEWPHGVVIEDL